MPISQLDILVGKSYRTAANEVRQVSALEKDEVVYRSIFATGVTSVMTVRTPDKRVARARGRSRPALIAESVLGFAAPPNAGSIQRQP